MTIPLVAQTSIQHYLSKGISKDVAVGIVACLYYESKLNPGSQGVQHTETPGVLNPSGAYGIASWNGPRQKALADFSVAKSASAGLLSTQLDFVLTECANSYPVVWAAIQNPATTYLRLIPIFVDNYEVPADKTKEINAALAYAEDWYPLITAPAAPPPVVTPTPTPTPTPAPVAITGAVPMDAALLAQLAPIIEALAAGLFRALITQLSAAPGAASAGAPVATVPTVAPVAPLDLGSLANALVPLLTSQLGSILPTLIAAEVAKLNLGAKP